MPQFAHPSRPFKKNGGFSLIRSLKVHIDRLTEDLSTKVLFHKAPKVEFREERAFCDCGNKLKILKTQERTVFTLQIGAFQAHETILHCDLCKLIYASSELRKLVAEGCNLGFDVMVHVGKAGFFNYRNDEEIMRELWPKNITISSSEIAYLQKRFIVCLALAHSQSAQRIRASLEARGGYILHLDGTCDGDSPFLMTGLDEISGIVLHNVKIPSESADNIIPLLERIKGDYGSPVAIVSDMAKGISNAVKEVFPGLPHFVCHFHFLRDIGNDLLKKENDIIRKRLKKHKITSKLLNRERALKQIIDNNPDLAAAFRADVESKQLSKCAFELAPVVSTYTLIRWALEGKKQGGGYGFPFDRPYVTFVRRLRVLYDHLERLGDIRLRGEWRDNRPFFRARRDLKEIVSDTALRHALSEIESKIEVFDRLRDAMRITVDDQHQGLNDDGQNVDIKTIKEGVEAFRRWLSNDSRYSQDNAYGKMIAQIDKYWEKLFADPITVDTPQGKVTFQPQRTDNIVERFFRDIKRGNCRKSGTNSMNKKLKTMLAQTPLVKNIENPEYLQTILNGKATLEERFAEIDARTVREELKKSREYFGAVPAKLRDIIKKPDLPQIVMKLFARQAIRQKSN